MPLAKTGSAFPADLFKKPFSFQLVHQAFVDVPADMGIEFGFRRALLEHVDGVEETYQFFAKTFSSPPRMSHEGMRAAIEMLQQRSPETKFDTNVSKYVDERLMDELEKEGFFKKIGGKS